MLKKGLGTHLGIHLGTQKWVFLDTIKYHKIPRKVLKHPPKVPQKVL